MISSLLLEKIENLEPGIRDVMLSLVEEVEFKIKTAGEAKDDLKKLRHIVNDIKEMQRKQIRCANVIESGNESVPNEIEK